MPAKRLLLAGSCAGLLVLVTAISHHSQASEQSTSVSELSLIQAQAENGSIADQTLYGLALIEGRYGLSPVPEKGRQWLERAAQAGDAYAAMALGNYYIQGFAGPPNPVQAVYWWKKAAGGGNPEAKYHLGRAYMSGTGVKKNARLAGDWLREAAEDGYPPAQYLLGRLHQEGVVVEEDHHSAVHWLKRAASNGHVYAVQLLQIIQNLLDAGMPLKHERMDALQKRALNHDPHAQYELALRYETGALGVQADPVKALKWFQKAAANGNPLAMHRLQRAFEQGELGVHPDPQQAAYWKAQITQQLEQAKQTNPHSP